MKYHLSHLLLCAILPSLLTGNAWAIEFKSEARPTDMIELYTSEGCSSCPPADRWFSTLKDNSTVFKSFIPLAFHVDYWNSLGWTDRFSTATFSKRQHQYVTAGNTRQAYTPQVVLDGKEWLGHLHGVTQWLPGNGKVGILKAAITKEGQQIEVNFAPETGLLLPDQQLVLNLAYVGMGLKTKVGSGENNGRELKHDFVVLQHQQQDVDAQQQAWTMPLPTKPTAGQAQTALVVWLSHPKSLKVVQAVGGYL